jgi:hypothetical protein
MTTCLISNDETTLFVRRGSDVTPPFNVPVETVLARIPLSGLKHKFLSHEEFAAAATAPDRTSDVVVLSTRELHPKRMAREMVKQGAILDSGFAPMLGVIREH